MEKLLSIIIPSYNMEQLLPRCLDSLLASGAGEAFEAIVVNDGSKDDTLKVALSFRDANPGCIRVIDKPNGNYGSTINAALPQAEGKYVKVLDADDWWKPEFLEEMDRLIAEYPEAGIYATNYIYYKPGKTHVALDLLRGYVNYPKAYLHGEMPVWTGATCMPRKVFDEMGGFLEGIKLGEDFLLWAKTSLHYKVAFCENPLVYYNNDVPVHMRATRNLHAPQSNMLFNLAPLESEIQRNIGNDASGDDWKRLLDKLRVGGLLEYWLNEEYHDAAAAELKKVDWDSQPVFQIRIYKTPIWMLKLRRNFLRMGSFCKQRIVRMCKA